MFNVSPFYISFSGTHKINAEVDIKGMFHQYSYMDTV